MTIEAKEVDFSDFNPGRSRAEQNAIDRACNVILQELIKKWRMGLLDAQGAMTAISVIEDLKGGA